MEKNKRPEGFAVVSVGKTGTGKTTEVKKRLRQIYDSDPYRDFLIFDPNHEFGEFTENKFDDDWKLFAEKIANVSDAVILVEEATICLDNRKKEGVMVDILVKKRHTNTIVFLNFHSWRAIPFYIFDLVNFVTIFKTNDTERIIRNKCDMPLVLQAYENVQKSNDKFKVETVDLYK